ncbi:MAG: putative tellurite resistance protein B-like protein [Glaciecola sp.]|jgi:uncharacterized tellurite resistance protein B-like protein
MLNKLKEFFNNELMLNSSGKNKEQNTYSLQQACALLLMEVSQADFEQSDTEKDEIKQQLQSLFDLSDDKLQELFAFSQEASRDTTSVYPFTSMINDNYNYDEKVNLLKLMWKVAYIDNELDKHEESTIRAVADLLYVSHCDFIKVKHEASGE